MQLLIRIEVDDLAQGIAFYRDALGLRPGSCRPDTASVTMRAGPGVQILLALPRRNARRMAPARVDWLVPDLERAVERALAAGADLEDWPQDCGAGLQAVVLDPFGNALQFVQWTVAEREAGHWLGSGVLAGLQLPGVTAVPA